MGDAKQGGVTHTHDFLDAPGPGRPPARRAMAAVLVPVLVPALLLVTVAACDGRRDDTPARGAEDVTDQAGGTLALPTDTIPAQPTQWEPARLDSVLRQASDLVAAEPAPPMPPIPELQGIRSVGYMAGAVRVAAWFFADPGAAALMEQRLLAVAHPGVVFTSNNMLAIVEPGGQSAERMRDRLRDEQVRGNTPAPISPATGDTLPP
jgi:hypothetical protein